MKNSTLLILALLFTIIACHRGRHVIISTQNNDVSIKIEYYGTIILNNDQSRIESISRNGYINYNKNGNQLYAAPDDNGNVFYEVNGDKTQSLDNKGRQLLAEAVKIIAKEQGKYKL